MAQKTFVSAMLTSADVNLYLAGEGGAWTSWTPTVGQPGAVTVTNNFSRFARYGRTIHFILDLVVTGTGVAGEPVAVSLPVAAAHSGRLVHGTALLYDLSANLNHRAIINLASTTGISFESTASTGINVLGVTGFTAALAAGDAIQAAGTYEAAS